MKSINFNTGIKRYAINGDESNAIAINVNDLNLFKRIQDEAEEKFTKALERLDNETVTPQLLAEVDKEMKEIIDYIFGSDISSKVFGEVNCLSPLDNGDLMVIAFFEAFAPLVMEDIKKSNAKFTENKKKKYIDNVVASSPVTEEKTDIEKEYEEFLAFKKMKESMT